jgi:hypothetical protein
LSLVTSAPAPVYFLFPFPAVLKAVNQAMLDQPGLELVPGRKPVEMLVVQKAN